MRIMWVTWCKCWSTCMVSMCAEWNSKFQHALPYPTNVTCELFVGRTCGIIQVFTNGNGMGLRIWNHIRAFTSLEMAILILVVRFLFKKICLESHPDAKEGSQTKHWISSVLYYYCVTANEDWYQQKRQFHISCFRGDRYLEWQ